MTEFEAVFNGCFTIYIYSFGLHKLSAILG